MVKGRQKLGGVWGGGKEHWARLDCVCVLRWDRAGQCKRGEKEWSKILGEALEKGSSIRVCERTRPRSTLGSMARGLEMGSLMSCLLTSWRRLETADKTTQQTSC